MDKYELLNKIAAAAPWPPPLGPDCPPLGPDCPPLGPDCPPLGPDRPPLETDAETAAVAPTAAGGWPVRTVPADMPYGDMPGDKVAIDAGHVRRTGVILPVLLREMAAVINGSGRHKLIISVCGGSGVGKSEIASLLAYFLTKIGIAAYTLSGDNYPWRIPRDNDAERLRIFRTAALRGLVAADELNEERWAVIREFQQEGSDAACEHRRTLPWYETYLRSGREGLRAYLGSRQEIDFDWLEAVAGQFKRGEPLIWLKRMGRTDSELWYEKIDFSAVAVMIIEWTHGNSDHLPGVDIPILLNSTPQETLAHRKARNRDGNTDSPFTAMVLELEQEMLRNQARKARIIAAKSGELLSCDQI